MSDHNKCPSSEKEHKKCIFRLLFFHRIQPTHDQPDGYTGLFHLCLRLSYPSWSEWTQHNVYGSFINLNSLHASQSRQYSALHWRHLQNCKTASIAKCLLKWHMFCVFDNSANTQWCFLETVDTIWRWVCSNWTTLDKVTLPVVPMCPCAHHRLHGPCLGCARVDVTIKCDTSKISGDMFWD